MKKGAVLQVILALLTCMALSWHFSSAKQKNPMMPGSGNTTGKADIPRLNAPSATLYYLPDKYKNDIIYDKNHLREFAFRVKGTKKKLSCWKIEGEGQTISTLQKKGL